MFIHILNIDFNGCKRTMNVLQRLFVPYDVLCYSAMSFDAFRFLSMFFGFFQCFTMPFNILWCLATPFNIFRSLLMSFEAFRCLSMPFDAVWCHSVLIDVLRRLSIPRDQYNQCCVTLLHRKIHYSFVKHLKWIETETKLNNSRDLHRFSFD